MKTFSKLKTKLNFGGLHRTIARVTRRFKRKVNKPSRSKISSVKKNSNGVVDWSYNPCYKIPKNNQTGNMSSSLASVSCDSTFGIILTGEVAATSATTANSMDYPETMSDSRDVSLGSFSSFRPSASSSPRSGTRSSVSSSPFESKSLALPSSHGHGISCPSSLSDPVNRLYYASRTPVSPTNMIVTLGNGYISHSAISFSSVSSTGVGSPFITTHAWENETIISQCMRRRKTDQTKHTKTKGVRVTHL